MRIWLVKTGEPLPTDGKNVRLLRMGIFAEFLCSRGHEVVWWNASYDHQHKKQRDVRNGYYFLKPNLKIILIPSKGYLKNISLERIRDHRNVANFFLKMAKKEKLPDIVLVSYPTIELADAVTSFGAKKNVPVLLDIRDLWPDIFLDHKFLGWKKYIGQILISPYKKIAGRAMKRATGITSISEPYLNWGLNYANRTRNNHDGVFPFGYSKIVLTDLERKRSLDFFNSQGIFGENVKLRVCLFATMSNSFDIDTMIEAAKYLETQDSKIQMVICGNGEKLKEYTIKSRGLKSIIFVGWVDTQKLTYLMAESDVGIAPYAPFTNFKLSITNKAVEYFSGGLPIITCIDGYLTEILKEYNCGIYYEYGNKNELIKQLIYLQQNRGELDKLKQNAFILFEKFFEKEYVYGDFLNHMDRVVKNFSI